MTNAEKSLSVMLNDVNVAAQNVVNAMNDGKTQKVIKDLKKAMKSSVDTYNDALAREYYRTLAAEHGHDAVKTALLREEIAIPDAIKVSIKVDDESNVASYELSKPIVRINLLAMQNEIGKEFFHNPTWFSRINALALLMANALNNDLGGDDSFQYAIDKAAEEFDLPKTAKPDSKSSMVKAFQSVIDDILWIGESVDSKGNPVNDLKFTTHDWKYIDTCMTREGKSTKDVIVSSPAKCTELVCKCIHNLLTGEKYVVVNG